MDSRRGRKPRGRRGGRNSRGNRNIGRRQDRMINTIENVRGPQNLKNNFPFPQSKLYKLTWNSVQRLNTLTDSFFVKDILLNSIQRPDQVQTSSIPCGVQTLKQIYNTCRVLKVSVKFTIFSNEPSLPTIFGMVFRDTQPSLGMTTHEQCFNGLEQGFTTGTMMIGQNNRNVRIQNTNIYY